MRQLFFGMELVCATVFFGMELLCATIFCMEPVCATVFHQGCYYIYVSTKITVI
jgi:hypothetical protein